MDLKELLGEELHAQVAEKLGDNKIIAYTGDKAPVLYDRFKEVNDMKNSYKEQYDDVNGKLGTLGEQLKSFEGVDPTKYQTMTSDLEALRESLASKESEMLNISKTAIRDKVLAKAQIKDGYMDLISNQININDLELDGDNLKGLEDIMTKLKSQYVDLFGTVTLDGTPLPKDDVTPDPKITKEQFKKMGYNERVKLSDEDPELFEALSN